ncbi:CDP-alcohol phosphatidyltransferase family protein [Aquincola sp. MAHUQ-54]|uniref:CDP-alcohol phosphatidyltransferase family protein n=1 Tax=Aquincola agrisoli TaxID=3119538 RepID=A0AAW9QJM2_9BURK
MHPPETLARTAAGTPAHTLRRDAGREFAAMALVAGAAAMAVAALAGLGGDYPAKAVTLYAMAAALAWRGLGAHAPHARFGAGNRLTLARLANVVLLAALVGEAPADPRQLAWGIVVAATLGAVLDAADGPLARAAGLASEFGARFDMETDALLTLVLCALLVQFDKVGAWVLASGLMRYAFVLAALRWPWLAAPLPPSRRRQAVCVVQITCLIVCLGPIVPRPGATALAAFALAALALSFAVDVRWLSRHRHPPQEVSR